MYKLPCAKLSTRITPKISERPAATSHKYMASLRPTSPWKSIWNSSHNLDSRVFALRRSR